MTHLFNRLTILPRWIVVLIDLVVILFSTSLGYVLRFNFDFDSIREFHPGAGLTFVLSIGLISILATRSYAGIIRYTGVEDGIRIMYFSLLSFGLCSLLNLVYYYNTDRNLVPYSVLAISFFVSFLFLFYYRLLVKTLFSYFRGEIKRKRSVAILGAGSLGILTRQVIESDKRTNLRVSAFLEDDIRKVGKVIGGVRIYAANELGRLTRRLGISELIIAINDFELRRKNEIVEECLLHNVKVRIVPASDRWVKGELKSHQIKDVNIEDLLGRETIQLEDHRLETELRNEVICITGAAGSIGSEITRQLASYHPRKLILIDQAESPLYDIEDELKQWPEVVKEFYVADITNKSRMRSILTQSNPSMIFHAAAYKHVPLMETNPSEAVHTNVVGTRIVADIAAQLGVRKFVMISTDKAVNPTSVMGCTKRVAEAYVQSLDNHLGDRLRRTNFVITRFGNVLGSNGSVIPTFKKQIKMGGPVTVTHPEVTRFFMTIPEACRLVLEAAIMGQGGEIFIFDMGKQVRILDLAKKMIKLSGFEPGKDIDIVFTGLRKGEKLFEELMADQENAIPTHHEKILKGRVAPLSFEYINSMIDLIEDLLDDKNDLKVVAVMKDIVPEFRSSSSIFEDMDF